MSFWVPKTLPGRVAFDVNVEPGHKRNAPMNKVYVTFGSHALEDFYGLAAQASFASMKNQTIPIFSREQGGGRGDQPITTLEDSQSWFSGGNEFMTYTAIPQYISSAARVFYLREEDTAFAEFDFTKPNAVTVRYDALTVGGHVMQADNMLNAITMLTDYVGKMPAYLA